MLAEIVGEKHLPVHGRVITRKGLEGDMLGAAVVPARINGLKGNDTSLFSALPATQEFLVCDFDVAVVALARITQIVPRCITIPEIDARSLD